MIKTAHPVPRAMELNRPLIYLMGISHTLYEVVHPAYVTGDSPTANSARSLARDAVRHPDGF